MLQYLKEETNFTTTENGAITHKSSTSKVLDYFCQGSALRNRPDDGIFNLVEESLQEDALLTLKVLFNSRDIRNGQGERKTFRKIIKYLAINHTNLLINNISLIPQFGRWDDMLALYNTPLQSHAIALINDQLQKDLCSETEVSLCAKWLPSENASSKETRRLAIKTAKLLGISNKHYRKILSTLRKRIDVLETKLTTKNYEDIHYDKIPSQAGLKYKKAFFRNDEEKYTEFLANLSSGKVKINTGTILPYQLVKNVFDIDPYSKERVLLNELWSALPDFIKDDASDTIAVIDTSGSMIGTPLYMAISLGLYVAEKNTGAFKNHFITFESNPHLIEVKGKDFYQKVENIARADWGGSTNIESTFNLILNTAIKNNLDQSQLPERIVIVSDMEFDEIEDDYSFNYFNGVPKNFNKSKRTVFEKLEKRFNEAGYTLPRLVFWNVNSVQDNIPMTMKDDVQLVSGPSPKLFEQILKDLSAYDLMLEVLNNKIYDCITL